MGIQVMPRTLQQWREEQKLTREELLTRTSNQVSLSTLRRIEKGEVEPHASVRKVLADALGVDVTEIEWPTGKKDIK